MSTGTLKAVPIHDDLEEKLVVKEGVTKEEANELVIDMENKAAEIESTDAYWELFSSQQLVNLGCWPCGYEAIWTDDKTGVSWCLISDGEWELLEEGEA